MKEGLKLDKRQQLRNNEYYSMQNIFDKLYNDSKRNKRFKNLMEIITSENNILLAYRNIKDNKGAKTEGTDGLNIDMIKSMNNKEFIERIQKKLENYHPKSVRRVEIPKPNGKMRPLGIPCIEDRIIQMCIKQVLEPICEAKFHKHSYGFRPNRSVEHAICRCMTFMNKAQLHYVVDVDIKGFFDNVNHGKLKKQMWNLGIQDKRLIAIIGKILKSEIEGYGVPSKGTPQGGIISPLLANIVLNELDWWLSSQWETFETDYKYSRLHKYRAMKKTNLKEIWFVRYADDFKIFCRDYKTAQKIMLATKNWLKERLTLEVSPEKTKITNLRKNYTEYLGFKLRVRPKRNKFVAYSRMSNKAVETTITKLKQQIKVISRNPIRKEVGRLNAMILGSHNYYCLATHVTKDFSKIDFLIRKTLETRLRDNLSRTPKYTETYKRLYGKYDGKQYTVDKMTIFPIYGCTTRTAYGFTQTKCNYSKEGREAIHKNLGDISSKLIRTYLKRGNESANNEFFDNSISLIAGQQGKCYVTKEHLEIGNMECHHKKPKSMGGSDKYRNLAWIKYEVHKLIHATNKNTIEKYIKSIKLDNEGLKRLNNLRKLVGNPVIQ